MKPSVNQNPLAWRLLLILALSSAISGGLVPAHAYGGGSCSDAALYAALTPAGSESAQCTFTLSCPGPTSCTWTTRVQGSGVGALVARLYVANVNFDSQCSGVNSCLASRSGFILGPGQSRAVTCNVGPQIVGAFVYVGPPVVNPSVSCSATVG
jgi:hypothetical protein